ncbi:acid-resistance protein HdeD [Escherichia coli]|uniref:Acid-resistance protein HdeD n=5 Tax=Escherichia coli TaxID=562 RepID=A0A8S0FGN3_ECOLX|nr:acid-resistance protein HdeD [Escherichia coli]
MLYIDKATILKFDLEMLKKHRRAIQFIAVLLFIVGLLCISFPINRKCNTFVSGDILSTVVGALLICSGIALIVGLFSNRSHNFWPVLSGFLVAVAYLLIGYFFIRAPELGIFAIAAFIAGLFCVAGVIRLMSWYRQRSMKGSWLQLVIGVLDIVIAWIFLGATPMVSVTLVSTLVGIELIFSAASLFSFASLFVKKQ